MKKIINIAQIGVGYWGPNLLRNLTSNKNCCVKTVIDLSEERRQYVKDLYPSIKVLDDISEILNDKDIHAVVISSPVKTHFDLAIKCLEADKHILVEKPMATTLKEINQIEYTANKKQKLAMVGHTFLYNSAVRYLKELIDSRELGDIRYIYSQRLNLGRIRKDVDALWNLAPHDVSIIQYLLDNLKPVSVKSQGMDYIQNSVNDVVFMNIVYPNKIMANIHVSWLDPRKTRLMTIVGSKKMVIYDDIAENKIAIFDKGIDIEKNAVLGENMDFDDSNFFKFSHRSGNVLLPKINFKEPLQVEISHFLDCILNQSVCMTGISHAKTVINILERGSVNEDFINKT